MQPGSSSFPSSDRRIRVLYVVSAYPRHPGDVITPWLGRTIEGLRERNVDVEVLAPAYRGTPDQIVNGVVVHRFRYAPAALETLTHEVSAPDRIRESPAHAALVPGYLLGGAARAARLARSGRFDLVHAHWPIPHGLIGGVASQAGAIPLILTFHGVELTWTRRSLPFLLPLMRWMIRTAEGVTANSTYTAGLIQKVMDRRVDRIPFGAAVAAKATPPPPFPEDSDTVELLFVGRLVERKGVHRLIDALALLDRRTSIRLTIVGDGPERSRLVARAAAAGLTSRVRFAGRVSEAALTDHLASSDCLVLPAVYDAKGDVEGLGVVLIEALAHGRPVIGSNAGGIPDIIRHGVTGLLVPPDDAAALACAIEEMAADRPAARAMGERGRADVDERFSWDRILTDLTGVYERVLRAANVE